MSMATLAILPPLHQDFRARKFLCSPGDGWRQYKPPPPPTVQPAFHFLVSLLEADAYAPLHPRVILRPVLDSRMYGKLQRALDLPTEVLARIVELVTEDGNGLDLALASKSFQYMTMPFLYRNVTLRTRTSIALFCDTLERDRSLAVHVRRLCLDMTVVPLEELTRLSNLLRPPLVTSSIDLQIFLECLTLRRVPASELQKILPILTAFAPRCFEWHTAPSWQMRPARLFEQLFASWHDTLVHLTLENFRFDDDVLVNCVQHSPSLRSLSLRGNGIDFLEADLISDLLQHPCHFNIANCKLERRIELQNALSTCSKRRQGRLEWL